MIPHWIALAEVVSNDTGVPIEQIMLLRHGAKNIRDTLQYGGSIEEYTSLQPAGSKYDFLRTGEAAVRVVAVLANNRVYDVYAVEGIVEEGATEALRRAAHRAPEGADLPPLRGLIRRFRLRSLPSRAVGQPIRGWERRGRTPVQRADGGFFNEIEVEVPTDSRNQVMELRKDLEGIESLTDESETTRISLAEARLGQGRFRRDLLAYWDSECAVTGCDVAEALRASHCKPWRDASDPERLDPANGLLLVATLDALFDAGLVAFDDAGEMLVASALTPERQHILGLTPSPLRFAPTDRQRTFLQYHREHVFRGTVVTLGSP